MDHDCGCGDAASAHDDAPLEFDADGTHWAYGFIERLADPASWGPYGPPTAGFEDHTFRPNNNCARAEMAIFIQRAAEFDLPTE